MAPDGREDGRTDGRTDGHGQIYIPPPSAGDKKIADKLKINLLLFSRFFSYAL